MDSFSVRAAVVASQSLVRQGTYVRVAEPRVPQLNFFRCVGSAIDDQ